VIFRFSKIPLILFGTQAAPQPANFSSGYPRIPRERLSYYSVKIGQMISSHLRFLFVLNNVIAASWHCKLWCHRWISFVLRRFSFHLYTDSVLHCTRYARPGFTESFRCRASNHGIKRYKPQRRLFWEKLSRQPKSYFVPYKRASPWYSQRAMVSLFYEPTAKLR